MARVSFLLNGGVILERGQDPAKHHRWNWYPSLWEGKFPVTHFRNAMVSPPESPSQYGVRCQLPGWGSGRSCLPNSALL